MVAMLLFLIALIVVIVIARSGQSASVKARLAMEGRQSRNPAGDPHFPTSSSV
jgi:hypothetical protein